MDPLDSFYQELDSQNLLERHGPELLADARQILIDQPTARLAGTIFLPDSPELPGFRAALAQMSGQSIPDGMLIGICPRPLVEPFLRQQVDPAAWLEEPWQAQQVLVVTVSTRDGFRFGFFRITGEPRAAAGEA
ncbi:MAG: hypothetical protein IPK26_08050 [Planctomycetes bacterium]|nr:hypothetical protein [Planctomycetota bacterium]